MSRPTVRDIAKEAGVSLATVDRVLNARAGVREKTIAKVQAAVERLGYVRDTYAANLARQRQYRFVFALPEGDGQFTKSLRSALIEAYASQIAERVILNIIDIPAHDPHGIVQSLELLDLDDLDGIAIMAPETPQVRDAIDRLFEAGVAVVAIGSDLPNSRRNYFVGIDNRSAGRTAASLMGRFSHQRGEILVVTNSMRSRDSLDRRLGFDQVISEQFDHLTVLPSIESFDDPARMRDVLAETLGERDRVIGVYSMGFGNRAVISAIEASGRSENITCIVHEITESSRAGLQSGVIDAVIAQDGGHLVRSALRVLRSICDDAPIFDAQERIRIEVILNENCP